MTTPEHKDLFDLTANPIADLVRGNIKAAVKDIKEGSTDVWKIPPHHLHVKPGYNPRVDTPAYRERIRELAESIKKHGFYPEKAIAVFVEHIGDQQLLFVHDGHTRLAAVRLAIEEGADIPSLPVVPVAKHLDPEGLTVSLLKSNEGSALTPYEKAMVYSRLSKSGWSSTRMADEFNVSRTHIDQMLELAAAPVRIREAVALGQIAANAAVDLMRKYGSNAVPQLESMLTAAKAEGKKKVTPKDRPDASLKRSIRKAAPKVLEEVKAWKAEPWWDMIPSDKREAMEALLAQVEEPAADGEGAESSKTS